jgi:hypothetical protein
MIPLYVGPVTPWRDRGSDREWIWSWRRILTTSRGAIQNLCTAISELHLRVVRDQEAAPRSGVYRDTKPAIPPAIMTWVREPWEMVRDGRSVISMKVPATYLIFQSLTSGRHTRRPGKRSSLRSNRGRAPHLLLRSQVLAPVKFMRHHGHGVDSSKLHPIRRYPVG